VPVGIIWQTEAELASLKRIRQIADLVIPGHDPDVVPGSAGLRLPPSARLPHVENTASTANNAYGTNTAT
jgi:glyoxylase-like metal-dependent hydrolase (beta-lactamase superfamily II)